MAKNPVGTKKKAPKSISKPLPEWAEKVRKYREEAKKSQNELRSEMKLGVNTMSLIERGKRMFTNSERERFFEVIGKALDLSIPAKPLRKAHESKPTEKRVSRKSRQRVVKMPAVAQKSAVSSSDITPNPGTRRPPVPEPRSQKMPRIPAKAVVIPAKLETSLMQGSKQGPKQGSRQVSVLSPLKEAVLRDTQRILENSALSDSMAQRLHNLFTSLTVSVLLEG